MKNIDNKFKLNSFKKKRMKTEVVKITPEMAKTILRKNTHNRPMNEKLVSELMSYIDNDQWMLTHQGIAISQTDRLLDGQHRLMAISRGKKAVPMLITTGLSDDTMMTIDIGKRRSVGDAFHLLEVKYPNEMASMIAKWQKLKSGSVDLQGGGSVGQAISIAQKYELFLEHGVFMEKALDLGRKCYSAVRFYTPSDIGAIAMMLVLTKRHSFASVTDFFEQLHLVEDKQQVPATRVLFHRLMQYTTSKEKIGFKYKIALTIKAWNFFKSSANVSNLKFDEKREEFPEWK